MLRALCDTLHDLDCVRVGTLNLRVQGGCKMISAGMQLTHILKGANNKVLTRPKNGMVG
jgi:hypothetical protein